MFTVLSHTASGMAKRLTGLDVLRWRKLHNLGAEFRVVCVSLSKG